MPSEFIAFSKLILQYGMVLFAYCIQLGSLSDFSLCIVEKCRMNVCRKLLFLSQNMMVDSSIYAIAIAVFRW